MEYPLLWLIGPLPPLPGLISKDLTTDPVHMYAAVIRNVSM
ncbi:hypothetical protein [Streptosporangium sp. NPDC049046]